MAPPLDPDKLKAMTKNPWSAEMLEKEVELLKLTIKQKEEEERFEKVGNLLQTLLGVLLCLIDMRLGIGKRFVASAHGSGDGLLPVATFHSSAWSRYGRYQITQGEGKSRSFETN